MKVALLFKTILQKSKLYCGIALFFLLFANQTFGQTTRYVSGSSGNDSGDCSDSSNPCSTITYAIDQALSGDIIEIANGIYTEALEIDKPLSLIGESVTGTIIQARSVPTSIFMGGDNVIDVSEGSGLLLSNVHIRNGGGITGGGINCSADLTLSSVILSQNSAYLSGGGLALFGFITATLTDVAFIENECLPGTGFGGGMSSENDPTTILTNVNFIENSSNQGGGLHFFGSTHTLKNVKFINNTSTAVGGGMSTFGSTIDLTNAIFDGNTAQNFGGGIFLHESNSTLRNVSLSENSSGNGGGIANYAENQSELDIINCIIWGNTADQGNEVYNGEEGCTIEGFNNLYRNNTGDIVEGENFNLENSLNEDPLFLNPANGNFGLAESSPAIDAGDPGTDLSYFPGGPSLPIDLNGNPRVYNSLIDIGAYEYQGLLECPVPNGISFGTITSTAAEVSWNPVVGETGGYNWFVMNFNEYPGIHDPVANGTTEPGITFATATGLTPTTMYFVFLQTNCNAGEQSQYAGPFMLTTSEEECEPPSDIIASDITPISVEVSWIENGAATEWEIEYGESGFPQGGGTVVIDNDGTLGETLTDLNPATEYDVYVRSVCDNDESDWTGPVNFFTADPPPCTPPSGITVNTVTDTVVFVSWIENGSATEWEVEYGESGFPQGGGTVVIDNDGTSGETIGGLTQGVEYDVYVRAVCEFSESDWEGPVVFVIEPEPCNTPSDIVVDDVTPTMVYVSWTENGNATDWEIEYGESGFAQGDGIIVIDNDGVPGEAINGLEAGTAYDIYVRAICEFSESGWMGPTPFTTEEELGITESSMDKVVLYPNPTTGIINLQTEEIIEKAEVYTITGSKLHALVYETRKAIDISHLSRGIYFVRITLKNKSQTYKIIKE